MKTSPKPRARAARSGRGQAGGFAIGLVVGLLVGLAVALGVALYITKAPIPFVNKVPLRTAEQDTAEAERNRTWDPNAALAGKGPRPAVGASAPGAGAPAPAASVPASTEPGAPPPGIATATPKAPARDPAAILSGAAPIPAAPAAPVVPAAPAALAADPFVYFVQAGAYSRPEDAEQQRARLGLIGQTAKVSEREQAGRTVYRVRVGPFPTREEADVQQLKLQEQTIETQIVRVERQP
jgi:cell division protein FtsN